jgi:hypothetical protein
MVGPEAWGGFVDELSRWQAANRVVEFWWRDDDACRADPALDRLYALAARTGVPLAVAAVPDQCEPAAFEGLSAGAAVFQHGADHRNRATAAEKKTEFPAEESVEDAIARLIAGRAKLESAAQGRVLPVLVPPWNRLSPHLVTHLADAGYGGLSTYGVRNFTNLPAGLTQINTHVDIIDWKGDRGFCGTRRVLDRVTMLLAARRAHEAGANEPLGWLTHHAVHDAAAWDFLETLFEATSGVPGICWRSPMELFTANPGGR